MFAVMAWGTRLRRVASVCAPPAAAVAVTCRMGLAAQEPASLNGHGTLRGTRSTAPLRCDPRQHRAGGLGSFSVGCYNVLCPTYAVKWGEREGMGPDRANNWSSRWPVMQDIIQRANWDICCLQEVEVADMNDILTGFGDQYSSYYFKHAKRPPDGVLIAVRRDAFECVGATEIQWRGSVAFGRVDLRHRSSGVSVRVVTAHMRGGNAQQLADLAAFADEGCSADVTVVTGDFNEDFGAGHGAFACPLPDSKLGCWSTLQRQDGLPEVSRPPHKQGPDQKSGKGKIDWIFVRGSAPWTALNLFRDPASYAAILESHAACAATGEWPSDHGCEALSVTLQCK